MENRGLLFIPDISGFSRFVAEIEINHSRSIIQELLEILIDANDLGLEISEIEGDAILFFKYGDAPDLEKIYAQVEKMFIAFHQHLAAYEISRYCHCKACTSAINLTLKVITHHGEFTGYQIQNFNKLIGKDVIVAHQLLKNDIARHEYWLVTDPLVRATPPAFKPWMKWDTNVQDTESGEIAYRYTQIGALRNEIPPPLPLNLDLAHKAKVISLTHVYDAPLIPVFHASGDFNNRHLWMEGVERVEEVGHYLPRVGMRCKYQMKDGQSTIYSSSYVFHPDKIEFGETDLDKKTSQQFTLEEIGDNKTQLTMDYYVQKNLLDLAVFRLTRRKSMEEMWNRSLERLEHVVADAVTRVADGLEEFSSTQSTDAID